MGIRLEEYQAASSLAVQWLRLRLPKQGVQVRLVVFELRSHMPWGQKNKTKKQYCNKFSIKWSTSKKKKKRTKLGTELERCLAEGNSVVG